MRRRGMADESSSDGFQWGAVMSSYTEKRRDDRFPIALNAHYSAGPEDGIGVLSNISYSGALIEDSSVQPTVGARVRVYVFVESADPIAPASPYELVGRVVRHSSSGFAIEYEDPDPDVRELVDDAATPKN
jgi:hypothetical protein